MSATAPPISPTRFAAALKDLPLSSLHAKAAELRNSIIHLQHSNKELQPFADEGDSVCKEAIAENEEVTGRMEHRILLLRAEVEGRGMPWHDEEMGTGVDKGREPGELGEGESLGNVVSNTPVGEGARGGTADNGERTRSGAGENEEGVFL